ncbi:tyrosine-type recombinase/integrase [Vibrio splendidus]|uniref:tyrosine-type recombinase/integrase n=1 Tax=Vibrio splendidus TaxID=29497 RepID=UPI000C8443D8|nr:tyrosine-type recombinase/integrase [Vibrio splendidus]CAK2027620.1 Integrase [Vibrio crassostreae]PMP02052.1 integrase [Vibrio splendidus]PMP20459.1 integrase [Vibrio splendidus]PMP29451.1 integrase [Vibrio splendidus]PMP38809.1 integrase [Vibrio splendidus]
MLDSDENQKKIIRKEVEISTISNFVYEKPLVSIDENGEPQITYRANGNKIPIKKLPLLYIVGYDGKDNLISYQPLEMVNEFLLSKAIDDGVLELGTDAQGLAHYFSFVLDKQAEWDAEYDEEDFDPLYNDPRPEWSAFPRNKQERLTYQYRDGIKQLAIDGVLAKTTARQYMSSVVGFYKHCLRQGIRFNNPPFQFETVNIHFEASASSMKAYQRKQVHTTDMRIKFSKSSRSGGTNLSNLRRDLKPFTNNEWNILQTILMKSRRVVRHGDNNKLHSLPIEFCLHPMICRNTGLRREEAASLHLGQIVNPETMIQDGKEVFKKPVMDFGVGDKYQSLTKTAKGFAEKNKSRVTIIPAALMKMLYDYSQSDRYQKRLKKFKAWCNEQVEAGNMHFFEGDDAINPELDYLFITQSGKPMFTRLQDFTGRWVEIRNTANLTQGLDHPIVGSIHNLRSTFAVNIFRHLLNKKNDYGNPSITPDEALDRVSALLGHEDRTTTIEYLKIAQDMPSADEIYEGVLDYIGAFDDLEVAL